MFALFFVIITPLLEKIRSTFGIGVQRMRIKPYRGGESVLGKGNVAPIVKNVAIKPINVAQKRKNVAIKR